MDSELARGRHDANTRPVTMRIKLDTNPFASNILLLLFGLINSERTCPIQRESPSGETIVVGGREDMER